MPASTDLAAHPLTHWTGPLGLPDFTRIGDGDFSSVFDAALKAHEAEIAAIAGNPEAPTVANTLAALELSGQALDRVSSIFWCKAGANTNDAIQALEREVSPKIARHFSAISMNEKLFSRIDDLYRRREKLGLDAETLRVLEKTWKGFVRSGAKLDAAGKKRLAAINEDLSSLGTKFGQNVLSDERDWALFLDEADLAGLPDFLKSAMAEAAEARGTVSAAEAKTLVRQLAEAPRYASQVLKLDQQIEKVARELSHYQHVLYLGRDTNYPLARGGALKLKEISYIHAEGYAAGELKHGPIALIDETMPVVVIAPHDKLFEKTISNMQEVAARGGKIILITDEKGATAASVPILETIVLPDMPAEVASIVYALPIQMLAYHAAVFMGTDVDQPRNLAKSVTVE